MFNNLIESSSHKNEFRRRGSFLLFTATTYVVLFVITGVVSIYAYDAHLDSQTTELTMLTFAPPPTPDVVAEVPRNTIRSPANSSANATQSIRTIMMDSTNNPTNPPKEIGTVASPVPPARVDSIIGNTNVDPITPGGTRGTPNGTGNSQIVADTIDPPPPPAPAPTPVIPKVYRSPEVLNGKALVLPKPLYPPLAKQIKLQGSVSVQVLIDESGRVLSAKAVSGHVLLVTEAQKAAMQARFSPTKIGEQPVKVSGVITYNFVLQP